MHVRDATGGAIVALGTLESDATHVHQVFTTGHWRTAQRIDSPSIRALIPRGACTRHDRGRIVVANAPAAPTRSINQTVGIAHTSHAGMTPPSGSSRRARDRWCGK